jgi:hypothetical protein
MCSTEHMPGLYENVQRYRLPAATFPLRFHMLGKSWELRTFWVEGGGHWRCYLVGVTTWNVCSGSTRIEIEHALRESGVLIPSKTFIGTAFRHLERSGVAQRL